MTTSIASTSGTFDIGGDTTVTRLGYGAAAVELTDEQFEALGSAA